MAAPKGNKYAVGNSGGAPTLYKPSYCRRVVTYGKKGMSRTEIAARLGVVRATLENWAEQHNEFLTALKLADAHSQAWWENKGRDSLDAKHFQSAVWKKTMEARFRKDYTTININQNIELSHEEWLDSLDDDSDDDSQNS